MVKSSVFITCIVRLYTAAINCFPVRIITTIMCAIGRTFYYSAFGKLLIRRKNADDYTSTSTFYAVLRTVWCGIVRFSRSIYMWVRQKNSASVNNKLYMKFVPSSYVCRFDNLLCACVCIMMIIPHNYWNNMYAFLALIVLSALYFFSILSGQKIGQSTDRLWLPLLFFIFAVFISVLDSYDYGDSFRVLVFIMTGVGFCFLIYGAMTSYERMEKLMFFMFVAVLLSSLLAIAQRAVGIESDAGLTDLSLNKGMPGRVFGSFGNPNNFAEFLMLFIPFCFAYALNLKDKRKTVFALIVLIIPIAALLLTYSRSGWLAFAIAVIVYVALYNWRLLPLVAVLGACCIPILPASIMNRILTIGNLADTSSSYRVDIWTGALRMLRKGFWIEGLGLGPESFTAVYQHYAVGATRVAPHSHMQFMEILIEMGILGFISFLWYSIALVRRSSIAACKRISPELKNVLIAGASSIAGITCIGFVEYTWFYPRVIFAFFIAAGITMAATKLGENTK